VSVRSAALIDRTAARVRLRPHAKDHDRNDLIGRTGVVRFRVEDFPDDPIAVPPTVNGVAVFPLVAKLIAQIGSLLDQAEKFGYLPVGLRVPASNLPQVLDGTGYKLYCIASRRGIRRPLRASERASLNR
jgi:hypothetical protein